VGNQTKLPGIRKEAFTKAREDLGLSTKDVSGMSCLSVRQIEQIENGETSSFYGDQVKFTAAKKVAGLLKLKPEDAFEFSEPLQSANTSEADEKQGQPEVKNESRDAQAIQEIKAETPPKASTRKISESVIDYSVKTKAPADPKKKIFLLLLIVAAVIFSIVNLRPLFFPEPVKEEVVIIQEVIPEAPAVNPPADPSTDSKSAAVVAQPEPVASTECPVADAAPLNYKPDAPKKAGDMVYLQSKTAQTICVVDASGKTQTKPLEPGIGVSVYGKPPFKVLTGGLNLVDIYYQGSKVRIGNTPNKTIILEAAEITQSAPPLTSSDSQLR